MPLPSTGFSPMGAATDLGLGDMLAGQVAGETEEQRKKRMKELQDRSLLGSAGSPAVQSLFGGGAKGGASTGGGSWFGGLGGGSMSGMRGYGG